MSPHRILSREVLLAAGRWAWNRLQGGAMEDARAASGTDNPFEKWTDADLVRAAFDRGAPPGSVEVEIARRLKNSLDRGNETATALTKRIERLNVWLLWATVAIGALTIVQVLIALKVIG